MGGTEQIKREKKRKRSFVGEANAARFTIVVVSPQRWHGVPLPTTAATGTLVAVQPLIYDLAFRYRG